MHGFVLVALLFIICHQTQTNNSAGKVGEAILHLHNRECSCAFWGKELQSVVERNHLTNTIQPVFQKVSIAQDLYVHYKPSLVFKEEENNKQKAGLC